MEDLYSLAIVGAGLSTLSALQAGLTSERTIVLDYQERPGGFLRPARVLLACGGLELPREQAQIPGPRPAGVITPIFAHQLLTRGYTPGTQIVVYGNSRYAQATALRLAEAGLAVTLVNAADEPG